MEASRGAVSRAAGSHSAEGDRKLELATKHAEIAPLVARQSENDRKGPLATGLFPSAGHISSAFLKLEVSIFTRYPPKLRAAYRLPPIWTLHRPIR
jgi:hypothetical protein